MQRGAIVVILSVLVSAGKPAVAHPNDSIARERIPPTPYGQRLARTGTEAPLSGILEDLAEEPFGVPTGSRAQYLAAVEKAEKSNGAYSPDLIEPLASAGLAFQAARDHGEAIDYFRRALHLSRVNEGLYSAGQLSILDDIIKSQLALGDIAEADKSHHYRFRVQQHALSDNPPDLIEATEEYIDWQRQLYLVGYGEDTFLRLLKMHNLQTEIIERLEAEDEFHPALTKHLYHRLESEYLLADYKGEKAPAVQINISRARQAGPSVASDLEQHEFKMIRDNTFRRGVKTLKQVVELAEALEPRQVEEIARAKIALGDWYLWWDWDSRALQSYEQAYALYAGDDDPATDPGELFREPVELPEDPVFRPAIDNSSDFTKARALVSLSVSQVGQSRNIEILELDAQDTMDARVMLYNMLREVRFRPLVVDGQVAAANSVVREYRFHY